ncbi:MAG: DUF2281 domain-containing protein [Deltaproteobacteria bacterium]|nr:DUF2281 domain-containing protein [Deltaproteobacteria bacterium]MBW1738530.1 DUF2281 domain-containing protein [Deltaproteobacteria bacterium]MBW1910873.1 DUF2281 domain-containing protein [Deltaproteobacteria bacterium]MBW2035124.1 DUF2281 domain-containing protein [Deltaproteobacteria bacterium]MBW2115415.1 DUF2281 domain-containing protein [Deltaproteobacteria bacterium]
MYEKEIEAKAKELPEHLRKEVLYYMEFLLKKSEGEGAGKEFKFDWEGGLSELKKKFTSVDLQHSALELR